MLGLPHLYPFYSLKLHPTHVLIFKFFSSSMSAITYSITYVMIDTGTQDETDLPAQEENKQMFKLQVPRINLYLILQTLNLLSFKKLSQPSLLEKQHWLSQSSSHKGVFLFEVGT
jgi:hypothetical protein